MAILILLINQIIQGINLNLDRKLFQELKIKIKVYHLLVLLNIKIISQENQLRKIQLEIKINNIILIILLLKVSVLIKHPMIQNKSTLIRRSSLYKLNFLLDMDFMDKQLTKKISKDNILNLLRIVNHLKK